MTGTRIPGNLTGPRILFAIGYGCLFVSLALGGAFPLSRPYACLFFALLLAVAFLDRIALLREHVFSRPYRLLCVLLAAQGLYGLGLIWRTTFEIDGVRYFSLFDDAMITMAYSKNLVDGYGLNWAKYGDPVEGYSHPLWLLVGLAANLLPVPIHIRSLFVQLVSLGLLISCGVLVFRIMRELQGESNEQGVSWIPAVLLTISYYPLNMWALQGMESALQAWLVLMAFLYTHRILYKRVNAFVPLSVCLSLALLLRMDMLLFVLWVLAILVYKSSDLPGSKREIVTGLLIILLPSIVYLAFRIVYFQDILPNTYYLKLTGAPLIVRLLKGLVVTLPFLYTILVPLAGMVWLLFHHEKKKMICFALGPLLTYLVYSIYVGGDAWQDDYFFGANRFVNFLMPLYFILFNLLLLTVFDFLEKTSPDVRLERNALLKWSAMVMFLLCNGLLFNHAIQRNVENIALVAYPPHVINHKPLVQEVVHLNQRVSKDALVATGWAGMPGYFGQFRLVDLHGYNDRVIAKKKSLKDFSVENFREYLPGHVKWDFEYVIRDLQPDLIFQAADPAVCLRYGYEFRGGYWVKKEFQYVHEGMPLHALNPLPRNR
jgi:arabinofuranosyltransferase